MNPRSNASAKPVPDPARNESPSFLQETNCPPRSPTAPRISGEAGYQHGTFSMSSSELQADDSEEGGDAEDKGGTPVDIITYMSSRLTGTEDECVADEEPDTVCPRTWVPRRCGRYGARRCGKGEGEECLFCGIDTTNGEKGQGKGKGKGKGPVPQQPQCGQRIPSRERSRPVPPWAKGASRSEEGKFDADQLD